MAAVCVLWRLVEWCLNGSSTTWTPGLQYYVYYMDPRTKVLRGPPDWLSFVRLELRRGSALFLLRHIARALTRQFPMFFVLGFLTTAC